MKIATIFAGQGSQTVGMGKDLYEAYSTYKNVLNEADTIMQTSLTEIMFKDKKKLDETLYAQPAIFSHEVAIIQLLKAQGIKSEGSCGLSLGEYAAYYDCDVFDFEVGLRTVIHRAFFMQDCVKKHPGKMCALLGDREASEALVDDIENLSIANYNSPKQVVAGGTIDAIDHAASIAKNYGVKRVIPINTSGAFHTDFMKDAKTGFETYLPLVSLNKPKKALYINTTGKLALGDLKQVMADQITNPVHFDEMILHMIDDGFDTFITIGPDDGLKNLIKKIDNTQTVYSIYDKASLEETLSSLKESV